MTLKEYMDNPSGKGSAINSKEILKVFIERFEKFKSEKREIKLDFVKEGKKFYILSKVQSSSLNGLFYDCIIEISPNDPANKNFLTNGDFKVYVNSPSFNFTFAYVFLHKDMIIKQLEHKYDKEVRKNDPGIRNPYKIIGYEKILMFTLLEISRSHHGKTIDDFRELKGLVKLLDKQLRIPEEILKDYNQIKDKENKIKKQEKEKEKKTREKEMKNSSFPTPTKNHIKQKVGPNKSKVITAKKKSSK